MQVLLKEVRKIFIVKKQLNFCDSRAPLDLLRQILLIMLLWRGHFLSGRHQHFFWKENSNAVSLKSSTAHYQCFLEHLPTVSMQGTPQHAELWQLAPQGSGWRHIMAPTHLARRYSTWLAIILQSCNSYFQINPLLYFSWYVAIILLTTLIGKKFEFLSLWSMQLNLENWYNLHF